MLVAAPDVDRPDAHRLVRPFAPAPRQILPFPSLLVASRTDPHASFGGSAGLAAAWGSELIDAGDAGHINSAAGLEDWPDGLALLDRLRLDRSDRTSAPVEARIPHRHATRTRGRRA